ncbi:flavoprotein [Thermothelomyces heterothallicus CBS 202.75]|uniref:flavoprotein n=1 Tax=Thermothelomyces heterothallicus CBS 202.75 TaxID=1149848 RepID=UPI003742B427
MSQSTSNKNDSHPGPSQLSPIESLAATRNDGKKHLLLAASGSVATIKLPVIIKALAKYEGVLSIRIVLTESATHFLAGQSSEQPTVASLLELPNVEAVYRDHDEWGPQSWRRGASILHIELRRWADLLVVAPLSANTLAKVVNGMSDNLLTSVIRAWDTDSSIDMKKKLILVAPAMNSAMWRHPITAKQIRVLKEDWGVKEEPASGVGDSLSNIGWFKVITPISKTLACGDTGAGAMASVDTICEEIEQSLGL